MRRLSFTTKLTYSRGVKIRDEDSLNASYKWHYLERVSITIGSIELFCHGRTASEGKGGGLTTTRLRKQMMFTFASLSKTLNIKIQKTAVLAVGFVWVRITTKIENKKLIIFLNIL